MTVLRVIALTMLAVQGLMFWTTMGLLPFLVVLVAQGVAGCLPWLQRSLSAKQRLQFVAWLALAYVMLWLFWMRILDQRSDQYGHNVVLVAGLFLLNLQAIQISWRNPIGLGIGFPILGALSAACAGDRYLFQEMDRDVYSALAMGYGALVVLYYTALARSGGSVKRAHLVYRYGIVGVCVVLSFLLAGGTALGIGRADRLLQPWMTKYMQPLQRIAPGNSDTARLGSMTDFDGSEAERIVLQIFAESSPGYLRGQVYADYTDARWQALPRDILVPPATTAPEGLAPVLPGEQAFPIRSGVPEAASMTIYPDASIRTALFAPERTGWIGFAADSIQSNEAHIAEASSPILGQPYRTLRVVTEPPAPLTAEEIERYTQLPPSLAERLRALSDSVCDGREGTLAKALAVTQYFTGNYEYSLDFEAPSNGDPLAHFLFGEPRPSAHCEYFASGAVMLLRAAGVPARYVTGIGAWEQHPFGAYWIARNRDAHAWCEAWDPEEGWFLVEATPAGGLPEAARDTAQSGGIGELWSMLVLQVRRLIDALRAGAWPAVAAAFWSVVGGLVTFARTQGFLVMVSLGVTAGLVWGWRRWRAKRRGRRGKPADPLALRLAGQLSAMDRHLAKKHRLVRPESTTLHQFAGQIEGELGTSEGSAGLASWYRRWAEARYQTAPASAAVDTLEAEMRAILRHK